LVQNTNLNILQNTLGILQGIYLLNTQGRQYQNSLQNTLGVLQGVLQQSTYLEMIA
jgi:hypothetical protein